VMRADGTGLRRVSHSPPDISAGSPKWSPDGRRIVFYELPVEQTWHAHRPELVASATSQIVSVDVSTGERIEHTSGPGLKLSPQFVTAKEIGYLSKGGPPRARLHRRSCGGAVDGHAVWSTDGRHILWNSGMHGWRDEAALYDNTFQPYAPIFIMNADGSGKRPLTDSPWEDAMPQFIPVRSALNQ